MERHNISYIREQEKIDKKFKENKQSVDLRFEESKRYFGVVAESLHNQIRQMAKGHQMLLDGQARIIDRLDRMERKLGAMIKFSYAELDSGDRERISDHKNPVLIDWRKPC